VPLDYGASWTTLFLSPLFGALAGWLGVALIPFAAQEQLNLLGEGFRYIRWDNPTSAETLAIAFLLGFSERFFDAVVGAVERHAESGEANQRAAARASAGATPIPQPTTTTTTTTAAQPTAGRTPAGASAGGAAGTAPGTPAATSSGTPAATPGATPGGTATTSVGTGTATSPGATGTTAQPATSPKIDGVDHQRRKAGDARDALIVKGSGFANDALAKVNDEVRPVEVRSAQELVLPLNEEDVRRIDAKQPFVLVIENPAGGASQPFSVTSAT